MSRSIYAGTLRVDVISRDGVRLPVSTVRLARAMEAAVGAAGARLPASVGLVLSDDAELAELNVRHMGAGGPTDVLSFPLLPPEAYPPHPGRSTNTEAMSTPFVSPPGRRPHLGDVVVSVERAVAQASTGRGGQTGDVGWSAADELLLLVTHGTLHLCGWDHAEPEEEAAMRALEARLLGR